jgi:hypothetical protein
VYINQEVGTNNLVVFKENFDPTLITACSKTMEELNTSLDDWQKMVADVGCSNLSDKTSTKFT